MAPKKKVRRLAVANGFSLRADTAVHAFDREELRRLCGYGARRPMAEERLTRLEDGRYRWQLRAQLPANTPNSAGTGRAAPHNRDQISEATSEFAARSPPWRTAFVFLAARGIVASVRRLLAELSWGVALVAFSCAGRPEPRPAPSVVERLATEGWADDVLLSLNRDCKPSLRPSADCAPNWFEHNARLRRDRDQAYTQLLEAFPLSVALGVASRDQLAELSGRALPENIDEHVMVLTVVVQRPTMPGRVSWALHGTSVQLTVSRSEHIVYQHDMDDGLEGFVVALGGPPRPSSLAFWKQPAPFASTEAYRAQRPTPGGALGCGECGALDPRHELTEVPWVRLSEHCCGSSTKIGFRALVEGAWSM